MSNASPYVHAPVTSARIKKENIVSVRMPKGLVSELRDLQKINHFMDISDEIRFVIRKYCAMPQQKSIDEDQEKKQQLISDLDRILRELKNTDASYEEKIAELKHLEETK